MVETCRLANAGHAGGRHDGGRDARRADASDQRQLRLRYEHAAADVVVSLERRRPRVFSAPGPAQAGCGTRRTLGGGLPYQHAAAGVDRSCNCGCTPAAAAGYRQPQGGRLEVSHPRRAARLSLPSAGEGAAECSLDAGRFVWLRGNLETWGSGFGCDIGFFRTGVARIGCLGISRTGQGQSKSSSTRKDVLAGATCAKSFETHMCMVARLLK